MTDDNPRTVLNDEDQPMTWMDLGTYDVTDVHKASDYLADFLRKCFVSGQKQNAQVGPMRPLARHCLHGCLLVQHPFVFIYPGFFVRPRGPCVLNPLQF